MKLLVAITDTDDNRRLVDITVPSPVDAVAAPDKNIRESYERDENDNDIHNQPPKQVPKNGSRFTGPIGLTIGGTILCQAQHKHAD